MATSTRAWPDVAIPPGELLAETLETLGLSQAELARRAGRPAQAINEIIRGSKEITPETALQFERVLGVPAHVWTRLEADYRHNKARLEDQARLKHELPLVSRYPYSALAAHGWVRKTRDALERLEELLRFFGVVSLKQVPTIEAAAFRRSRKVNASPEALAAWLRQGEREGQVLTVAKFSAPKVRAAFPETPEPDSASPPRVRATSARAPLGGWRGPGPTPSSTRDWRAWCGSLAKRRQGPRPDEHPLPLGRCFLVQPLSRDRPLASARPKLSVHRKAER